MSLLYRRFQYCLQHRSFRFIALGSLTFVGIAGEISELADASMYERALEGRVLSWKNGTGLN